MLQNHKVGHTYLYRSRHALRARSQIQFGSSSVTAGPSYEVAGPFSGVTLGGGAQLGTRTANARVAEPRNQGLNPHLCSLTPISSLTKRYTETMESPGSLCFTCLVCFDNSWLPNFVKILLGEQRDEPTEGIPTSTLPMIPR